MHQSTQRVIKVLEMAVADSEGKRLSDFSRELQIAKSTLSPILQTLCETKYLQLGADSKYTAGTALFSLGTMFTGCFPVLDYVREQLEELVAEFDETCYWGVLEDGEVLYLDKVDSSQPLRVLTNTGKRGHAYATSLGKAMLIGKTEAELRALYPDGLAAVTAKTVTDFTELVQQLECAKIDGYTWEVEESTEYIRCFAAPVYKNGRVIAAVSMAIPIFRYDENNKQQIIRSLKKHAMQIGDIITRTGAHFGSAF